MDAARLAAACTSLADLVARLRGPGGCPWDARQTEATIKIYLLEEAYEVLEAIETGSPEEICAELGDLLFQVLFLAQLAAERREFDLLSVIQRITEKMIRRHPHVFGDTRVNGADEVARNWSRIKQTEKGANATASAQLKSVPVHLPALLRAHRLTERAAKAGLDWDDREAAWQRAALGFAKLSDAVSAQGTARVGREIGRALFSLAQLARLWQCNAEDLLRAANQEFLGLFSALEESLARDGVSMAMASAEQLRLAWEEVQERNQNAGRGAGKDGQPL